MSKIAFQCETASLTLDHRGDKFVSIEINDFFIEDAISLWGENELLEEIGKERAKEYWDLVEKYG